MRPPAVVVLTEEETLLLVRAGHAHASLVASMEHFARALVPLAARWPRTGQLCAVLGTAAVTGNQTPLLWREFHRLVALAERHALLHRDTPDGC